MSISIMQCNDTTTIISNDLNEACVLDGEEEEKKNCIACKHPILYDSLVLILYDFLVSILYDSLTPFLPVRSTPLNSRKTLSIPKGCACSYQNTRYPKHFQQR